MLDKACGVDVHKDLLVASVLSEGFKETRKFSNSLNGFDLFKGWLRECDCKNVVMESSGVYWAALYCTLEDEFNVVLANPRHVKAIPGRKTDQSDSEWLAKLLRNGLVKPSYVPDKRTRQLRELTRLRVKLVETRTDFKNRCHKILERANIRLSSALSCAFGRAGTLIIEGLMAGKSIDQIIEESGDKTLKRKREKLLEVVRGTLEETDIYALKECVDMVKSLDERIRRLNMEILRLVSKDDVEKISKVPGVGKVSAPAVLAEIGDAKRFPSQKHVISWTGLAPTVYQSAGHNFTGHITKKGSKWLRRIMVEVATAASKARGSRLRLFFLRVKARRGYKVAIVALARKILGIIWHLLVTGEEYVEEGFVKVKGARLRFEGLSAISVEEMISVLESAGYIVRGPFG
jgi:transposase